MTKMEAPGLAEGGQGAGDEGKKGYAIADGGTASTSDRSARGGAGTGAGAREEGDRPEKKRTLQSTAEASLPIGT